MSTAARVISGTVASWAIIAVTMCTQIILVPIYLRYWSVKTYGIWLAVQGIMGVLSMLDMGYQNYMGYEFLRLGPNNILRVSKALSASILFGVAIATLQILLILLFIVTDVVIFLIGESGAEDPDLINQASIALLLQGVTWLIVMTVPGLAVKALSAFGYFPRMAWWAFSFAIISAVAPLIAVLNGADLMMTSIVTFICSLFYAFAQYIQLAILLKKEKIRFLKPSWALGYSNFLLSIPLSGKALLENIRQQGVRLLVAPLAGPIALAAFSTMRTGANVALQGLNTIIHPLLPDLMRFLHDRDQGRSEAGFATLWIVVVAFMAPGVVILQTFVEPFYLFWTQGKIAFDPVLFSLLSLGVLVYAVIQPAMAIVVGNNLTKIQLALAAVTAVIVLSVLVVLMPLMGIVGAAIALLLAEIAAAIGYNIYAQRWLAVNNMVWPKRPFILSLVSVLIAAISLAFMIWLPQFKYLILAISMALLFWNFWNYCQSLPLVAVMSFKRILTKIPGLKKVANRMPGLTRRFLKTN